MFFDNQWMKQLTKFETEAQCEHVQCYVRLGSRMRASGNGNLTCPQCNCTASIIIHHQPIRLDDGLPYLTNTPQKILGSSEGHECGICFEVFKLSDADLGTMDTMEPCRHIFCYRSGGAREVTPQVVFSILKYYFNLSFVLFPRRKGNILSFTPNSKVVLFV